MKNKVTLAIITLSLSLGITANAEWQLFEDFENFDDIADGESNDKWVFAASDVGTTADSNASAVPDPDPAGAAAGNTVLVMDPGSPFENAHRSRLINKQGVGLPPINYGTTGTAFFRWYTATVNIDGTEFPPEIDMNVGMSAVDVPTQYNESGPVSGYDIGEAEFRAYNGDPDPDEPGSVIGFQNILPNSRPNNVWVSQWYYVRNYDVANQRQDYQIYYRIGETGTPILGHPNIPGEFAGFRAKPDGDLDPASAHLDVFYFTNSSGTIAEPQALDSAFYADDIYIDQDGINLSDPLGSGGGGPVGDITELVNISTRGEVLTGDKVMIAGFVIGGESQQTVLIRAAGPTLGALGVAGALEMPSLTLTTQAGAAVASNTGWENADNATDIAAAAAAVGAFEFPAGAADSAILVTLDPGAYTAQISGVGGTTGVALAEVYRISE